MVWERLRQALLAVVDGQVPVTVSSGEIMVNAEATGLLGPDTLAVFNAIGTLKHAMDMKVAGVRGGLAMVEYPAEMRQTIYSSPNLTIAIEGR